MITTRRKYWLHISSTNQAKPQVNTEVSPQNARNFGLGRSAEGADGDLTAIGYEYFAEHRSTPAASLVMRTHGQEGAGGPTSLYDRLSGEQQVAVTLAKVRGE